MRKGGMKELANKKKKRKKVYEQKWFVGLLVLLAGIAIYQFIVKLGDELATTSGVSTWLFWLVAAIIIVSILYALGAKSEVVRKFLKGE